MLQFLSHAPLQKSCWNKNNGNDKQNTRRNKSTSLRSNGREFLLTYIKTKNWNGLWYTMAISALRQATWRKTVKHAHNNAKCLRCDGSFKNYHTGYIHSVLCKWYWYIYNISLKCCTLWTVPSSIRKWWHSSSI